MIPRGPRRDRTYPSRLTLHCIFRFKDCSSTRSNFAARGLIVKELMMDLIRFQVACVNRFYVSALVSD